MSVFEWGGGMERTRCGMLRASVDDAFRWRFKDGMCVLAILLQMSGSLGTKTYLL
jgi:hypothetical protein